MIIETVTPEKIKLPKLESSVYLEDFGEGKGKIIVDSYGYGAFSYYWGSMGSDLKEFLKYINSDYFAGNLSSNNYTFSGKKTASEVRRAIKDAMSYWEYMPAQKELRAYIKNIEYIDSSEEFVRHMQWLDPHSMTYELESDIEANEFVMLVEDYLKTEPWHFIMEDTSEEYKFLQEVHKQLKKNL